MRVSRADLKLKQSWLDGELLQLYFFSYTNELQPTSNGDCHPLEADLTDQIWDEKTEPSALHVGTGPLCLG